MHATVHPSSEISNQRENDTKCIGKEPERWSCWHTLDQYSRARTIDETDNRKINRSIDDNRPIDDQSIITQKWSQLIDCHRLALKNLSILHVPVCTYTHSQYAQTFEIWIRSPDCLYAVAWFQKSTTETHFKTVFWRNTSQKNLFAKLFFAVLYTDCWCRVDMNL